MRTTDEIAKAVAFIASDAGEIVEAEPPRRLVIRWQHQDQPELKAEGPSLPRRSARFQFYPAQSTHTGKE